MSFSVSMGKKLTNLIFYVKPYLPPKYLKFAVILRLFKITTDASHIFLIFRFDRRKDKLLSPGVYVC